MTPPKQQGLGRGLDALLAANTSAESQRQEMLAVGMLQPGKHRPLTKQEVASLKASASKAVRKETTEGAQQRAAAAKRGPVAPRKSRGGASR